jgi:hypothetical protein
MLKALATLESSTTGLPRKLYLFGLSDRNLELLRQGKEIVFDGEGMGIPGAVCIFHGKTEEDLLKFAHSLPSGMRSVGDPRHGK